MTPWPLLHVVAGSACRSRRVRRAWCAGLIAWVGMGSLSLAAEGFDPNYAEALQKSIYFYEQQESGALSPKNRAAWRGPSAMEDGKDVGLDLSGGWYDAGDHWKANATMAYTAGVIALGAVAYDAAYTEAGQWDELLNGLRHVNDYFLRCVVDPKPDDLTDFENYALYIDVGGRPGPDPGVHSVWCAPEVLAGHTVRQAVKVNAEVPGPDVAYAMAAAMASNALLIDAHGELPTDKDLARRLLPVSRKLFAYAQAHPFNKKYPIDFAVPPDGTPRKIEYRDGELRDNALWAALWLHRAEEAMEADAAYDGRYLQAARDVVAKVQQAGAVDDVFRVDRDLFQGQYPYAAAMLALMTVPSDDPLATTLRPLLERHLDMWAANEGTPGGMKVRSVYGGLLLKWLGGASLLAQLYSDHVDDPAKKAKFADYARSQVNYMLGDNPRGRSYMIGFGQWDNTPHHRGATGPWAGFDHINEKSPLYLEEARHVLYGGVMGGPDLKDGFKRHIATHVQSEVALDFNAGWQGVLAGQVAKAPGKYKPLPDDQFPPAPARPNLASLDPNETDKEFFVVANEHAAQPGRVRFSGEIWNKSAWPARITEDLRFRYVFTPRPGSDVGAYQASLQDTPGGAATIVKLGDTTFAVDVSFAGEKIYPNQHGGPGDAKRFRRPFALVLSGPDGWTPNEGSLGGAVEAGQIVEAIAVYNGGERLGGNEPK